MQSLPYQACPTRPTWLTSGSRCACRAGCGGTVRPVEALHARQAGGQASRQSRPWAGLAPATLAGHIPALQYAGIGNGTYWARLRCVGSRYGTTPFSALTLTKMRADDFMFAGTASAVQWQAGEGSDMQEFGAVTA